MPLEFEFERKLETNDEIGRFIKGVLLIEEDDDAFIKIRTMIFAAEMQNRATNDKPTSTSKDFRETAYSDEADRRKLRKQIVRELIEKKRLSHDDDIKLEKGGAKPKTKIKKESKAFVVIGLPASGKSWLSNKIADREGAYVVDSDYAKRKFPEYHSRLSNGASIVHDESDHVVFDPTLSTGDKSLFSHCVNEKINIVVPKIGHSLCSIESFCRTLKDIHGYSVFLVSVDLSREKATLRAYLRYEKSGRYVPLAQIFDRYANEPTLNYFRLKQKEHNNEPKKGDIKQIKLEKASQKIFSGFMQISSDVDEKELPVMLEQENMDEYEEWLRRS